MIRGGEVHMCSRAFRYRAYLTDDQFVLAMKTIGSCRFVYNDALNSKTTEYRVGGNFVSYSKLSARLTQLKKQFSWLKEADSIALQQSLRHLDTAFTNFFRKKKGARYPKYKSKHRSKWSYTTMCVNRNLRFENDSLLMPKLGRVRIAPVRPVPADWILKSATLTIERDHTVYVSVCFEYEDTPVSYTPDPRKAVGLDYKSDGFYADSEGNVCGSPKYARKAQELLTKQQRKLRHKKKGSRN